MSIKTDAVSVVSGLADVCGLESAYRGGFRGLQILSLSVFEKMPIQQAFAGNDYIPEQRNTSNQLNLFDF
jgi:hypothetical protein